MNSAELLRAARLEEAYAALASEVRDNPGDLKQRLFLFQLHCVLGRYDKALSQLQVVASLNAETMLLAQVFRPVIACELLRQEVFAGARSPLIFGEPEPWLGQLVQANALVASGQHAAAAQLRAQALDAAPATPCNVDGTDVGWLADADSRLGPVTEAIIQGKYYWLPFSRVQRIELEKPSDLRDLVWLPVSLVFTNGGQTAAHIPVRYPGTEKSEDGALRLSRRTEFSQPDPDTSIGLGQRIWASDLADHPMLECRKIEFKTP